MAPRFNFQALDILNFWSDTRGLPVSIAHNQIAVSSGSDLSHDAEKVCKFISFIIGHHWKYRTVKVDNQFKTTFYEVSKTAPPSEPPEPIRRKRNQYKPKTKTLFD